MTNDLPLINVTLRDEEGKKVTMVKVPNFAIAPGAIVWSDRVFMRRSRSSYWECFAYVVPDPTPMTIDHYG